ncbi:MAG: cysteine--tRNA ligase [Balneolales bacterium]
MQQLHIFNTLTRQKELFTPLKKGFVGLYVCGPTVYGDPHLGHAKSYTSFDVIVRYLRFLGYQVRYVQNITDVGHLTDDSDDGEDKMEKQSRIERLEPMELAEKYTCRYFRDMDRLKVLRPNISPRATGHIPEQIAMIKTLIAKGHAYETNGNVYFDVTSVSEYGKLSGRSLDDAESGTRVEQSDEKKHPADFALWKKADKSHIMQWDSPWGSGFPGWHIECSAMATKYLGKTIDIHGGGLENQFPHHECEIAQCEGANNQPFVRYWMHNNMVTLNGRKMGKSLGNAITLDAFFNGNHDLLSRPWAPEVIRFFLLQSHYRSTTDFSESALESAEAGYKNLVEILNLLHEAGSITGDEPGHTKAVKTETAAQMSGSHQTSSAVAANHGGKKLQAFDLQALKNGIQERMNDDFNTAKTIGFLFEQLRPLKSSLQSGNYPSNVKELSDYTTHFCRDVLAIWSPDTLNIATGSELPFDEVMQLLLNLRKSARENKDFDTADRIRNQLIDLGITIEDSPGGSTYKLS